MGITPGGLREIEKKKKTVDQSIGDPNIFIKNFPLDPWTPYLVTNRFVQQGINRLLGFSPVEKQWVRLKGDKDGRLITTAEVSFPPTIELAARRWKDVLVFDDVALPAGGTLTHEAVDISDYGSISFLLSTTGDCTLYPQGSNDGGNFYNPKGSADADRSWNCNNEKILVHSYYYAHYIRLVVHNDSASEVIVRGVLTCQV